MADYSLGVAYDIKNPVLNNTTSATSLAGGPGGGIYFSAAGACKITTLAGTDQTFAVVTGTYIPVSVQRVWDTGTDIANTSIHVLYPR